MDPNNPQSQGDNNLQKLEEDLAKLSESTQSNPPVPVVEQPVVIPTPPLVHEIPQQRSSLAKVALALIVVAVLALAAYFVGTFVSNKKVIVSTPTPSVTSTPAPTLDPTANWKTYTNKVYGVSFKYPPRADVYKCMGEETLKVPSDGLADGTEKDCVSLIVGVNETLDITLSFVEKNKELSLVEYANKIPSSSITTGEIDGRTTQIAIIEPSELTINRARLVLFEITPTIVGTLNSRYDDPKRIEEFDQILSTFKFISPTVSPTPPIINY